MVSPEYSFRQLSFSLLLPILNQNSKIVSQRGMTGFEYRLGWCFLAFQTVCDVMLRNVLDVCIYWCGRRVNICLKKIYFLSVQRSEIFNICIVTFWDKNVDFDAVMCHQACLSDTVSFHVGYKHMSCSLANKWHYVLTWSHQAIKAYWALRHIAAELSSHASNSKLSLFSPIFWACGFRQVSVSFKKKKKIEEKKKKKNGKHTHVDFGND